MLTYVSVAPFIVSPVTTLFLPLKSLAVDKMIKSPEETAGFAHFSTLKSHLSVLPSPGWRALLGRPSKCNAVGKQLTAFK